MKSKKLLFINPHQFGHTAGYYYYCYYLRDDFDVTFLCFDKGLKRMSIEGVNVIYIPQSSNKFFRIVSFIKYAIQESYRQKYDYLYIYSFYFSFIIALLSRSKVKILDIRTGSIKLKKSLRRIENYIIRLNAIFFRHVVVLSNELAKLLKIKDRKWHLLPLGSQVYFEGVHNFDAIKLLYIGAFNTRRIHQTLIGFHKFLINNHSDAIKSYTIIGFGNQAEESLIRQTITKLQLDNYVELIGRKSYDELPEYFMKCNIGVSWVPITPSFNLQPATKTFEYILSGLFCIATSTQANSEVINSLNGVLCEDNPEAFKNALQYISDNRLSFCSNTIRETLLNYTWENLVKNNLNTYLLSLKT